MLTDGSADVQWPHYRVGMAWKVSSGGGFHSDEKM